MPRQDALLYARHLERRQSDIESAMAELGYDRLLIHSGRPMPRFFDDQAPPYRANAVFVSLVPLPEAADSLLEFRPGRRPRLWYCQPGDYWHLPPPDPESWWADALDVEVVDSPKAWRDRLDAPAARALIGRVEELQVDAGRADLNPEQLIARLDEARTRKTAWERHCIGLANERAVPGHRAAARAFSQGASEHDIQLAYLSAVRQDQDALPYSSIVALNEHAAVLHYQHRQSMPPARHSSFLIDAGASQAGYAADITRTYAMADQDEFAAVISAMDRAQQRLCDQVRADVDFVELHQETHRAVAVICEQAGLVRMAPEDQVEAGITSHFFPHGLGHFIGAQVHDVAGHRAPDGSALPPPTRHPALRLTRRLEPGNVVTIEPGLYFIPMLLDALKASSYSRHIDWQAVERLLPCGGVRIEDNVLVTEGDPVNLTRQAFETIQD